MELATAMSRHFWLATRLSVTVAAILIMSAGRDLYAAFEDPPISAQAAAMGGSSLAGQGDASALFLNAAAVAGLKKPEAYLMYNQLYAGMSGVGNIGQNFAAFGVPTQYGVVAIGYSDFDASGLLNDRVIGVTFARSLFDNVQIGITGKYLYQNYLTGSDPLAASDPVFSKGTARGAPTLDVGLIDSMSSDLKLGLSIRNINQPNIGLMTTDQVPRQIQGGVSYNIEPWALRVTSDYTEQAITAGTLPQWNGPDIGLEKSLEEGHIKFRLGATLDQFSGGIGVQYGPITFDYTFILAFGLFANNMGTQMVGLRYQFGGSK